MLTSEVKQKIDAARQVLVGKIPNPIGQVQEITNALIYKFMDDMDEKAISMGGKRRYFSGDYEKYSWRTIMNPKIGAHERLSLYTEALSRMSENPNIPELFRNIFRNAYLPFNDPRTLTLFLNEVNFFDYKKTEELGDAYEYLLSIMGSQGDAGQFRTPRHIIDFIVKAVNPTKDDSVLDPACGTAGFLISAYKHVMSKHDGINDDTGNPNPKEKLLTADEKNKLHKNYKGFDIDDNMVKISQVNLYLHGFPDPNIIVHDTLSSEDFWNDRYDIILANPPFMSPKGGIVPHSKFGVKSNRSEVLFVDYIVSHLKPKGRSGIIVPEGIVFQSGNAYKQLRKNLVEDGLYAVVSLPSGVFNPYAGVKTSVLLFDNDISKQRDEMLFIKIENDGFDLGAQRKQSDKNDLPTALDILDNWKKGEKVENTIATYVKKSKIAENKDYNLSGDRYRVNTDYTNTKWPMVELEKLSLQVFKGLSVKNKGDVGKYCLVPSGANFPNGINWEKCKYFDTNNVDTSKILQKHDILINTGGVGTLGRIGLFNIDRDNCLPDSFILVLRNTKNDIKASYIWNVLQSQHVKESVESYTRGATGITSIKTEDIISIKIPLPPIQIQEQIVKEVDGYQKIIDGAKQVVDNWKPKIDIDPKWERVKLGKKVSFSQGVQVGLEDQLKTPTNGYEKFLRIENYTQNSHDFRHVPQKLGRGKFVNREDVVVVRYGASAGFIGHGIEGILANNLFLVMPEANKLNKNYLYYYLNSDLAQSYLKQAMAGGAMPALSFGIVKDLQIFIPSLEIQKQIVDKIEKERKIVEANKELIQTYEQKIKDVISKLWEE